MFLTYLQAKPRQETEAIFFKMIGYFYMEMYSTLLLCFVKSVLNIHRVKRISMSIRNRFYVILCNFNATRFGLSKKGHYQAKLGYHTQAY